MTTAARTGRLFGYSLAVLLVSSLVAILTWGAGTCLWVTDEEGSPRTETVAQPGSSDGGPSAGRSP